jgi:hypothetical protein
MIAAAVPSAQHAVRVKELLGLLPFCNGRCSLFSVGVAAGEGPQQLLEEGPEWRLLQQRAGQSVQQELVQILR